MVFLGFDSQDAQAMKNNLVGVDLGGTFIKAGVTDASGGVLSRVQVPTGADRTGELVAECVAAAALQAVKEAGLKWADVPAVGVGSPGTIDLKAGVVTFCPNIRGLDGFPLRERISERIEGIPVVLENDANAAAKGEQLAGAGQGAHSLVMFTLGTGIGSGIVIENRVWHGCNDVGSELGHMTININGPRCGCGNSGCVEAYASATAMVRRMRETIAAGTQSILAEDCDGITARKIHQAALAGDVAAHDKIRQTGRYLGVAISNVLHAFNPQVVVLGGGVTNAGEMLMEPVQEEVNRRTLKACLARTRIRFAELGENAGFIGAAGCAMEWAEFPAQSV